MRRKTKVVIDVKLRGTRLDWCRVTTTTKWYLHPTKGWKKDGRKTTFERAKTWKLPEGWRDYYHEIITDMISMFAPQGAVVPA